MSLADAFQSARQAWPLPQRPRPIVLIGAGGIVRSAHLPAYAKCGFFVDAVFDVDRATSTALATDFQIPLILADLEALGRAEEAVFDVAVPAGAVVGVLRKLPRGAAVLIQKPMGRDLAEATEIEAVCRERGLTAALNFQLRFSPALLALRDVVDSGALGTVTDLEVRVNTFTPWALWEFLKNIPRHELVYHSIHYLDAIRSLLGEPRSVFSRVVRHPELPDYADVSSATVLDYGDFCRCLVSVNHAHAYGAKHAASELKLEGTRGAAVVRLGVNLDYPRGVPDELEFAARSGSPLETQRETAPESAWQAYPLRGSWFPEAFAGPMSNLQRFIAGEDARLETSVTDAQKTMAVVEACYESSAHGGTKVPGGAKPEP